MEDKICFCCGKTPSNLWDTFAQGFSLRQKRKADDDDDNSTTTAKNTICGILLLSTTLIFVWVKVVVIVRMVMMMKSILRDQKFSTGLALDKSKECLVRPKTLLAKDLNQESYNDDKSGNGAGHKRALNQTSKGDKKWSHHIRWHSDIITLKVRRVPQQRTFYISSPVQTKIMTIRNVPKKAQNFLLTCWPLTSWDKEPIQKKRRSYSGCHISTRALRQRQRSRNLFVSHQGNFSGSLIMEWKFMFESNDISFQIFRNLYAQVINSQWLRTDVEVFQLNLSWLEEKKKLAWFFWNWKPPPFSIWKETDGNFVPVTASFSLRFSRRSGFSFVTQRRQLNEFYQDPIFPSVRFSPLISNSKGGGQKK